VGYRLGKDAQAVGEVEIRIIRPSPSPAPLGRAGSQKDALAVVQPERKFRQRAARHRDRKDRGGGWFGEVARDDRSPAGCQRDGGPAVDLIDGGRGGVGDGDQLLDLRIPAGEVEAAG